jgi:hypothetical protein
MDSFTQILEKAYPGQSATIKSQAYQAVFSVGLALIFHALNSEGILPNEIQGELDLNKPQDPSTTK